MTDAKQSAWKSRLLALAMQMFATLPGHEAQAKARDYVAGSGKHSRAKTGHKPSDRKRKRARKMAEASRKRNRKQ